MRYEEALARHQPLNEYEQGLVDGIYRYAWMRDGVYYVGTTGSTLGDAIDRALTEYRAGRRPADEVEVVAEMEEEEEPPRRFAILVATYGDGVDGMAWSRLAQDRAYGSAHSVRGEDFEARVAHYRDETLAGARNELAKIANAHWLCFLDADDELEPGYLDAMREALGVEYDYLEDGWAVTGVPPLPPLYVPAVRYLRDDQPQAEATIPNRGRWPAVNECVIGTLVHRRLFEMVGGFRDHTDDGTPISLYEDWDLWLRCNDAGAQLVYVEAAVYRAHFNQTGRNVGTDPKTVYDAIWRDHLARTGLLAES